MGVCILGLGTINVAKSFHFDAFQWFLDVLSIMGVECINWLWGLIIKHDMLKKLKKIHGHFHKFELPESLN